MWWGVTGMGVLGFSGIAAPRTGVTIEEELSCVGLRNVESGSNLRIEYKCRLILRYTLYIIMYSSYKWSTQPNERAIVYQK